MIFLKSAGRSGQMFGAYIFAPNILSLIHI